MKQWRNKVFPKIRAEAKRVGAKILFGDEAGIRSDFHAGTTWAQKGKTPVIKATGSRFGMNMISAVSSKGELRFMVVEGTVKSTVFISFLKRLISDVKKKVFLIVDGHPTHKSKLVKNYVESTRGKLRLFYLPPYSPELNPDELVWNNVKNHGVGRKIINDKSDLKNAIIGSLRSLQKRPKTVQAFFRHPDTLYAA